MLREFLCALSNYYLFIEIDRQFSSSRLLIFFLLLSSSSSSSLLLSLFFASRNK